LKTRVFLRATEALEILVEKFPGEIDETLKTLVKMFVENSNTTFTQETGVYKSKTRDGLHIQYYSIHDIVEAKNLLLKISAEKKIALEPSPSATSSPRSTVSWGSFFNRGPVAVTAVKKEEASAIKPPQPF
jgi:hypothetical protein